MKNNKWHGQHLQDKFVASVMAEKENGTFVDLGVACPRWWNNTFILENFYKWTGIGVDIQDASMDPNGIKYGETDFKKFRPNTHYIIEDCLKINYLDLFKKYNMPNVIDYLSLDLEPPTITMNCLFQLPLDDYKFNVITFETDGYRNCPMTNSTGNERHKLVNDYLTNKGYVYICNIANVDDCYIHTDFINQNREINIPILPNQILSREINFVRK